MPKPRSLRRCLRLPSRIALMLGLGALSTAGARADGPDQSSLGSFGDLSIRADGAKIYLSEGGREFRELQLSDTPQTRYLRDLLGQNGSARDPAGLRVNPIILAGGGGTGISLRDLMRSVHDKPTPAPQEPTKLTAPPAVGLDQGAQQGSAAHDRTAVTDKKE